MKALKRKAPPLNESNVIIEEPVAKFVNNSNNTNQISGNLPQLNGNLPEEVIDLSVTNPNDRYWSSQGGSNQSQETMLPKKRKVYHFPGLSYVSDY